MIRYNEVTRVEKLVPCGPDDRIGVVRRLTIPAGGYPPRPAAITSIKPGDQGSGMVTADELPVNMRGWSEGDYVVFTSVGDHVAIVCAAALDDDKRWLRVTWEVV